MFAMPRILCDFPLAGMEMVMVAEQP